MSSEAARFSRSTPSRTVSSVTAVAMVSFTEHLALSHERARKGKDYRDRGWIDVHPPAFWRTLFLNVFKLFSEI
jgi:hypothetical protein